jgi:Type II secretion system (T2SS), protein M
MSIADQVQDRARDFWDRISPRERNLVILLVIATPIVLALWLGSAIRDGLDAMEHHNDRDRKALAAVETMRAKGESKPLADDSMTGMPSDLPSLQTYVSNAAKKAKLDIKSISPRTPQAKSGFQSQTANFQIDKVDIQETKDLLNALETDSKFVAVTKLELQRDFRDKDKLRADVDVTAYAHEAPKGGSGDAGSAVGSATTKASTK